MWTNYHCHTNYCDGKKSVAEVVERARELGMRAIGLSSHAPLPFERPWCMKANSLQLYLDDIRVTQSRMNGIEVYAGLEVDFIPNKTGPHQFVELLDYTVGSVHFVDTFPNGDRWEIDSTLQVFQDGVASIFGGDVRSAIERYLELTREMVDTSTPHIVGHLDKIKIHNTGDRYFRESDDWYQRALKATLDTIAAKGCIVEVNTRGVYQKKTTVPYPSPWVMDEMRKRDIPVTLSSDAHHPDDLTNSFPEAARALVDSGFKKIRILLNGRWTDVSFSEHGIDPT